MARRPPAKEIDLIRQKLGSRPLVLVGLMGAGKTTVGRRLAERLDIPFVDADHEIETAAGKTVAEIFTDHGEPYFREGERKVIARLLENGAQILATGGGAFMNDETRAAVRAHGVSLWLKADLALLMKRVKKRSDRPLLRHDDPEAIMRALIETRYPVYAEADLTVESRDAAHASMVNDVVKTLGAWQGWERAA